MKRILAARKGFYKELFVLVMPIVVQNLIASAVGMADVIMLGLISAFVLKLSPIIVYLLMCTDEFAKMPFAVHHYRKGNWIRNITREIE